MKLQSIFSLKIVSVRGNFRVKNASQTFYVLHKLIGMISDGSNNMLFNMGVLFDMFYNMAKRTMSKRTNVKQKQFVCL